MPIQLSETWTWNEGDITCKLEEWHHWSSGGIGWDLHIEIQNKEGKKSRLDFGDVRDTLYEKDDVKPLMDYRKITEIFETTSFFCFDYAGHSWVLKKNKKYNGRKRFGSSYRSFSPDADFYWTNSSIKNNSTEKKCKGPRQANLSRKDWREVERCRK